MGIWSGPGPGWLGRLGSLLGRASPGPGVEAQFRRLAEGAIDGIVVHDGERRFFANAAYARMYGYPDVAAVIAARETGQHLFPEDVAALHEDWRRILNGQQSWKRQRVRRRKLDGTTLWVDLVLAPIVWEGRLAIQGVQADVTPEVEAIAQLERSEARFRGLAEESLQGIVIHDGKRRLYVNRTFARMMGYRDVEAALAGDVLGHVPLEERAEVIESWRHTIGDQQSWERRRVPRRRVDGALIWIDLTHGPVMWADQPAIRALVIDVTREVEAEAELRRSERRLRAVIDNLPQALTLKDADRRFRLVNHAFEDWYGVNAADAIGKRPEDLRDVAPSRPLREPGVRIDDLSVLATGRSITREHPIKTASGGRRESMVTKFAVRATDGFIDGVGTIVTDLTALKEAQAELVKRESDLRRNQAAILRVLHDELSGASPTDRIPRILKLAGEALDADAVGVWRLFRDEAVLRIVERWRAPGEIDAETEFPATLPLAEVEPLCQAMRERLVVVLDSARTDPALSRVLDRHFGAGRVTATIMALIPVPDGRYVHVGFGRYYRPHAWSAEDEAFARSIAQLIRICFFQDELEQRERALRTSEARFRSVLDNLPLVLTLKDANRRFHIVNREFERWYGVDASAAIGHTPEELTGLPSLSALAGDEVVADERAVLATGRSITRERRRLGPAGETRDIIVTKFPVRDPAQAIDGVGTLVTEVTALKAAQQQLIRRETELTRNQAALLQVLRDELTGGSLNERIRRALGLAGETLGADTVSVWRRDRDAAF
ncbi:MAG: PAS domain S-box protein, partial [Alphaproteobacteria bacterium]|nr:PAS domain S-box protein [Alphaproteobacteria bacterium]